LLGDKPIIIELFFMGSRGFLWVRFWEVKILWVRIMGVTLVFGWCIKALETFEVFGSVWMLQWTNEKLVLIVKNSKIWRSFESRPRYRRTWPNFLISTSCSNFYH
jgi:hypothetical protein